MNAPSSRRAVLAGLASTPLLAGWSAVSPQGACVRALGDGHSLGLRYGGDGIMQPLRRVVPLGLVRGWNGTVYLMAEQIGGPSRSGTLGVAKTFRLDRIRSAQRLAPAPWSGRRAQPPGFVRDVLVQRPGAPLLEPFHLRSRRRKAAAAL